MRMFKFVTWVWIIAIGSIHVEGSVNSIIKEYNNSTTKNFYVKASSKITDEKLRESVSQEIKRIDQAENDLMVIRDLLGSIRTYFAQRNYRQAKMIEAIELQVKKNVSFKLIKNEVIELIQHIEENDGIPEEMKNTSLKNLDIVRSTLNSQVEKEGLKGEVLAHLVANVENTRTLKNENIRLEPENNGSVVASFSWISFFLLFSVFGYSYFNRRKKGEVVKKSDSGLSDVNLMAVCRVNSQGVVVEKNRVFDSFFGQDFNEKMNWDDFYSENFVKEKRFSKMKRIFKYVNDVKNDYFVGSSINKTTGERVVEIFKFSSLDLAKIGNYRKQELERDSVNALDVLEDVIAEKQSFTTKQFIGLPSIGSDDGAPLYLDEENSIKIFNEVCDLFAIISKAKNLSHEIDVSIKRNANKFYVESQIKNCTLTHEELGKTYKFGAETRSILEVIRKIETVVNSVRVHVAVKNTYSDDQESIDIQVEINDLDFVKWHKKTIGREREVRA